MKLVAYLGRYGTQEWKRQVRRRRRKRRMTALFRRRAMRTLYQLPYYRMLVN